MTMLKSDNNDKNCNGGTNNAHNVNDNNASRDSSSQTDVLINIWRQHVMYGIIIHQCQQVLQHQQARLIQNIIDNNYSTWQ